MVNLGDGSKYFRESFRGFNREDVINFVTKMIKEYSENEEKHRAIISESNADLLKKSEEIENLNKTLKESNTQMENLKNDLRKKTININEIQEKYSELHEECKSYKAKFEAAIAVPEVAEPTPPNGFVDVEEIEKIEIRLNQQIVELNNQLSTEENEKTFLLDVIKKFELETGLRISDICDSDSLENKKISFENNMIDMEAAKKKISAMEMELSAVKKQNEELNELNSKPVETPPEEQKIYESITSDLGNVIYSAKKTAETIVEKAKEEADDIMSKANMKRTLFFEEYERDVLRLKEKYSEIKEKYARIMDLFKNSYESYSLELMDIETNIENVYNKF